MMKKTQKNGVGPGKTPSKKNIQSRPNLPPQSGFDISDQDTKRRIGHFGGTGEPHMQKRGRGDR